MFRQNSENYNFSDKYDLIENFSILRQHMKILKNNFLKELFRIFFRMFKDTNDFLQIYLIICLHYF